MFDTIWMIEVAIRKQLWKIVPLNPFGGLLMSPYGEYFDEGDCDDFYPDDEGFEDQSFDDIDEVGFADPGGESALRAATPDNPREYPCPTCGAENMLTRLDVYRGYQCNVCADRDERGGY
jgi:hypothetical protein